METRSNLLLPERNSRFENHERLLVAAVEHVLTGAAGNQTVVITGGPGAGKTATGVELVHRIGRHFSDGSLFFEFSGDAEQPESISQVLRWALAELGVPAEEIPDLPSALRSKYRAVTADKSLIVFLDGVVSDSQVRALRPGPGASLLLVTEARAVTPVDAEGVRLFVVEPLDEAAALRVLAGIVGADRVGAESAAAVEIVRLCGCLPLALSIVGSMIRRAALRTRAPLADTATRLRDERRHRSVLSLNMVFGAAYGALTEPARRCYRVLGLRSHGGVVSPSSVAAVLGAPEYEVEEWLIELADNHLIQATDDRYGVRELVARHSRDIDERASSEREAEEARLLRYYDERIAAADELLAPLRPWRRLLFSDNGGAPRFFDAGQARTWLSAERRCVRAAAEYAFDAGQWDLVVRWCVLLWPFHEKEKFLDDLLDLHRLGIEAARNSANTLAEGVLHLQLGFARYWLREFDSAASAFTTAIGLTDNIELVASAYEGLGLAQLAAGDIEQARISLRHNEQLARRIDDPRRIALAVFHRAKAEAADIALPLLEESFAGFSALSVDETENLAKVRYWRGRKLAERDEIDSAVVELELALEVMSVRRRSFDQAEICTVLAEIAGRRADLGAASARFEQAIAIYANLGLDDLANRAREECERLTR
nr:NB-ARC domain-containing protein [Nocardia bovistercoris]